MNDSCIFCKIIRDEIPSICIYEDNDFKVILDKFPSTPGHTLIVPKQHSDDIFGLSEDITGKVFPLVQKVAGAIQKSMTPDGINILQNNGEAAGQSVLHFHVHIIPRFKNDDIRIGWKQKEVSSGEFENLSALISSNL